MRETILEIMQNYQTYCFSYLDICETIVYNSFKQEVRYELY